MRLKIDCSFVSGIDGAEGKGDQAIIKVIIAVAKGLELRLIAEGVETSGWAGRVSQGTPMQGSSGGGYSAVR